MSWRVVNEEVEKMTEMVKEMEEGDEDEAEAEEQRFFDNYFFVTNTKDFRKLNVP